MTTSGNESSGSLSTARDRAHHMAGNIVDKVQETANRLVGSDQGNNMHGGSAGGSQSPPMTEQATEQVTSRLDMGKEYVVETMTGVAQALRQTGQHLREDGAQPTLAQYADRGAEQIESFSGYLRRRDTGQLVTDVEGFARRQPMAFAGGAFALGMLAVRFLRSKSAPQGQSTPSPTLASYGNSAHNAPPRGESSGSGMMTAGSASTPPGGYTAAAQAASDRANSTPRPSTSGGSSAAGSGVNPGTPAAPGPGYGTSGRQSERPASNPSVTPRSSGTTAGTGSTPSTPVPGARTGGSSSTSERTGAGDRNQP